jgi:hypothetical protein
MSSEILSDMIDLLWQKNHEIDSILIVRNGFVVLDTYSYPQKPETKHTLFSCTKSVVSALIGIAIEKGYIKSIDQPLLSFFPEKIPENPDSRKQKITLKHVLKMATGLDCKDSYLYGRKELWDMQDSEDWTQHVINLPMKENPDSRFEYCNGASYLLTAVLQKTTKSTGLEFAKEHLFNPLGITDIAWKSNAQGITIGYVGLYMRPRDMARFGYLYLMNGKWGDRQIVPAHWVAESTRSLISADSNTGYGYQWWVMSPERYAAIGYSGQRIYVIKDKNMVVAFTSMLQERKESLPYGILMGYILPAVKSDKPIKENPEAYSRLKSLGDFWQTANYIAKRKKRKELTTKHSGPVLKTYLNKRYGFSVDYDSELVLSVKTMEPPLVFTKKGLLGLPVIFAAVDDIPDGLKLEDSEKAVFRHLEEILNFTDMAIHEKEVIRLSDGTMANYFEFTLKHRNTEYLAAGVVGYKDKKIINITAYSVHFTRSAKLKDMVTTLRLKIEKP